MDGTGPAATGFARQLAALKRRGCTVLVTGDVAGTAAMSRQLLGERALDRRHVLVPTTVSVADLLSRRPGDGRDPARLGVVDASGAARAGVAAASAGPAAVDPAADWYDAVDAFDDVSDLSALTRRVAGHVRRLAPADPEPGELRFCLDSLDPFLDAVDDSALFRFVHVLAGLVRGMKGLGHVHVAESSLAAVEHLRPLFDATVRVRTDADGTARQHWTVHESGTETDWLPVEAGVSELG